MFRLILCVEVIEVAVELVEAVYGRQELIAVAKMVLAELSGHVSEGFEKLGNCGILVGQPFLSARQSDLQEPRPKRALAGYERRASCGAGLLAVVVREDCAFVRNSVDVWGPVPHHAPVV